MYLLSGLQRWRFTIWLHCEGMPMGTKNYVVDDRCIVPPEIKMLSAAELAEKIAEYEQVLPPLKHNEAEIELPIHIE